MPEIEVSGAAAKRLDYLVEIGMFSSREEALDAAIMSHRTEKEERAELLQWIRETSK